jgi:hypothetical protein
MKRDNFVILVAIFFPIFLSAQCLQGNCQNGKGTFLFESGAKYSGEFLNGTMHGQGILTFTNGDKYLGAFQNHFREGKGKFIFANGDEYIGNLKKNKFTGEGIMKYANGTIYEGNWEDNKPNGLGEIRFSNGSRYEGMVKNGNPEGEGVMFYANKTKYEGAWKAGKRNGNGKMTETNGEVVVGVWQEDKPSGNKVENYTSATPNSTEQEPKNPKRNCNQQYCHNCQGEYTYSDGTKYFGDFKNGNPEGKGTVQYATGDRYVGGWSEHSPHGEGIMYYKNGRVFGGVWNHGDPIRELENMANVPKEHIESVASQDVKVWALVVGVGRYAHMPTLKYTDDDAYHFYSFLKSPEGGALRDEQIKVLIDEDATRENMLRAMRQLFLKADENDVVMLYFSGHGLEGSFLPVDYDGFNNKVRHDEIKVIFEESKAKHKVCLADACFSGSLFAMKSPDIDIALNKYYKSFETTKGGLALLMSSKSQEYSLEDHGLRSGIFSHFMIKGLKGEADLDKNKIVTIKELFDFTYKNVKQYTASAQTPTISGNYDPKMPVGLVR